VLAQARTTQRGHVLVTNVWVRTFFTVMAGVLFSLDTGWGHLSPHVRERRAPTHPAACTQSQPGQAWHLLGLSHVRRQAGLNTGAPGDRQEERVNPLR
jgi:hypothetical protein